WLDGDAPAAKPRRYSFCEQSVIRAQIQDLRLRAQDTADAPWNHRLFHSCPNRHPSTLMFANFITLPHFSVSSPLRFPNSAGVIDSGSTPKPTRRAFMAGSKTMALISLLSFSTMMEDVARGAPMPFQPVAS